MTRVPASLASQVPRPWYSQLDQVVELLEWLDDRGATSWWGPDQFRSFIRAPYQFETDRDAMLAERAEDDAAERLGDRDREEGAA